MNLIRRIKQFFVIRFHWKNIGKFLIKLLLILLIFFMIVPFSLVLVLNQYYKQFIYTDVKSVPTTRVAIVFGAGLSETGTEPSGVLEARIMAAIDLYKAGKVEKIIMSGDNRYLNYNEPQVMIEYAKANGVSSLDLQADYAGRRTYDTCYRAKYIFGVEKAVLITQDFHLTRALYTCSSLGIDAVGYVADNNNDQNEWYYTFRDFAATLLAYWELNVNPPTDVVLGDKINF